MSRKWFESLTEALPLKAELDRHTWVSEDNDLCEAKMEAGKCTESSHGPDKAVVVDTGKSFGKVLHVGCEAVLTDADAWVHYETVANLALNNLKTPAKRVFIAGGGSLGLLREVLKHRSVTEVVLREPNPGLVQLAKQALPYWGEITASPHYREDLVKLGPSGSPLSFLKEVPAGSFDAILVDLERPNKKNHDFYTRDAFFAAKAALGPGGVMAFKSTEGFCSEKKAHCRIIPRLYHTLKSVFGNVALAVLPMSLYQANEAVFVVFAEPLPNEPHMAEQSKAEVDRRLKERIHPEDQPLRYYSGKLQQSAFTLPGAYNDWIHAGDVEKKFALLTRFRVENLYKKVPARSVVYDSCGCKGCAKADNAKGDEL